MITWETSERRDSGTTAAATGKARSAALMDWNAPPNRPMAERRAEAMWTGCVYFMGQRVEKQEAFMVRIGPRIGENPMSGRMSRRGSMPGAVSRRTRPSRVSSKTARSVT